MTESFAIGETEFGVEPSTVRVEFPLRPDGLANVHIEVGGSEETFELLSESEEWSWALYPPFFFIRLFPVAPEDAKLTEPIEISERGESFEMNLYMMEYCEVKSVSIRSQAETILITGRVDLWGKDLPFEIRLKRRV